MKEHVIVTQANYIASAVKKEQYPQKDLKEVVFIGRSNVGKSSLINSLVRQKKLAKVSGQPGKTQTINFFEVGMKIKEDEGNQEAEQKETRRSFCLVDLPGYGYAKTGREKRRTWAKFINEYLLQREEILFVCQLIDIRHDPMPSDIEMFHWLVEHGLPVLVIATKADKVSRTAQQKQLMRIKSALSVPEMDVLPYSSLKNDGRMELLDTIAESLTA